MVTLKDLYIHQIDIDKIFDIILSYRVNVLGLDEDEEEEQNKLVDLKSEERFNFSEIKEQKSVNSVESPAACPRSDNQKVRRRSVSVFRGGLLDSQFAALYGRQSRANSVVSTNARNGLLKREQRTVALKQNGDNSNASSNRPSLVSRLSFTWGSKSSQRPSFLGSWGSRSSQRPSFLGS